MMDKVVLDSPALEKAVMLHSEQEMSAKRPGNNYLRDIPADSLISRRRYNGDFTLNDVSRYRDGEVEGSYRVAVCNGETWNSEEETSSDSILSIIGRSGICFVKSTVLLIRKTSQIYAKYNPFNNTAECVALTQSPYDGSGYHYALIGDAVIEKDEEGKESMKLIQRHGYNRYFESGAWVESLSSVIPVDLTKVYMGDFALRIIEPDDEDSKPISFAVCNGATWNPKTKESGVSIAFVNNMVSFKIPSAIYSIPGSETTLVYLCFDIDKYNEYMKSPATSNVKPIYIQVGGELKNGIYYKILGGVHNGKRGIDQSYKENEARFWAFFSGCK